MIKQKISKEIWSMKYQNSGESEEQFYHRIVNALVDSCTDKELKVFCDIMKVSTVEAFKKLAYELISRHNCMLAGRPIYALGTDRKNQTYSNCFSAGHKVITKNGIKNIEDVEKGDEVLSHSDNFNVVNETMTRAYDGEMVNVSSHYFPDIQCTPNHEFYTLDGWVEAKDLLKNNKSKYIKVSNSSVSYKKGKIIDLTDFFELEEGYEFVYEGEKVATSKGFIGGQGANGSKTSTFANRYLELNSDVLYLLGRWIGDGSITKRKNYEYHSIFQIVFNATKEKDSFLKCKSILENEFGVVTNYRENKKQNTLILRVENPILGNFIYNFMKENDEKILPNELMGSFDVLLGILDSDGCLTREGKINLSLKQKGLLTDIRNSFMLNGILPSNIRYAKSTYKNKTNDDEYGNYMFTINPYFVSTRMIKQMAKKYEDDRVELSENRTQFKHNTLIREKDGDVFVKVNKIEFTNETKQVYNLSVEIDNSYNVNGVICHNCYVLPIKKDSMSSIMDAVKEAAMTMKSGGGNGYSFSVLRPKNANISTSGGESTGPISFMKVFDSTCDSIKGGNNRRGAQMGVLDVWHPDIEEFIEVKQTKGVLTNFNISVGVSDDFMKAVENDSDWDLVFPDTNHESYNEEWYGNIKEWKEKGYPVEVYETVKAKDLYEKIMKATYKYSEPGVLFLDTINNENNLWYEEYIAVTNPCCASLQG